MSCAIATLIFMLYRLYSLTGLALAIGITVPAVQQTRSAYLPAAVAIDTGSTAELSTLIAQTALIFANNPLISTDTDVASSALAAAPQSDVTHLEIYLGRREVLVYQGEKVINRYPIGVGRSGWETPTGTFQVQQMRENPTWISPFNGQRISGGDDRNPLGTRWIGFWTDGNNWIGFHGTRNPQTVGRNASHGCLHMHRADLEDLYRQVTLGTPVTVRP
jgi:lipoprotein-anchoring transpeptidase ErfK/SrfK